MDARGSRLQGRARQAGSLHVPMAIESTVMHVLVLALPGVMALSLGLVAVARLLWGIILLVLVDAGRGFSNLLYACGAVLCFLTLSYVFYVFAEPPEPMKKATAVKFARGNSLACFLAVGAVFAVILCWWFGFKVFPSVWLGTAVGLFHGVLMLVALHPVPFTGEATETTSERTEPVPKPKLEPSVPGKPSDKANARTAQHIARKAIDAFLDDVAGNPDDSVPEEAQLTVPAYAAYCDMCSAKEEVPFSTERFKRHLLKRISQRRTDPLRSYVESRCPAREDTAEDPYAKYCAWCVSKKHLRATRSRFQSVLDGRRLRMGKQVVWDFFDVESSTSPVFGKGTYERYQAWVGANNGFSLTPEELLGEWNSTATRHLDLWLSEVNLALAPGEPFGAHAGPLQTYYVSTCSRRSMPAVSQTVFEQAIHPWIENRRQLSMMEDVLRFTGVTDMDADSSPEDAYEKYAEWARLRDVPCVDAEGFGELWPWTHNRSSWQASFGAMGSLLDPKGSSEPNESLASYLSRSTRSRRLQVLDAWRNAACRWLSNSFFRLSDSSPEDLNSWLNTPYEAMRDEARQRSFDEQCQGYVAIRRQRKKVAFAPEEMRERAVRVAEGSVFGFVHMFPNDHRYDEKRTHANTPCFTEFCSKLRVPRVPENTFRQLSEAARNMDCDELHARYLRWAAYAGLLDSAASDFESAVTYDPPPPSRNPTLPTLLPGTDEFHDYMIGGERLLVSNRLARQRWAEQERIKAEKRFQREGEERWAARRRAGDLERGYIRHFED